MHRETKFIIGFDFAVALSSPASSCVLFDITSRQLVELKWLMLNKHKRWFHSSREKIPLSVCLRVGFWCPFIWFGFWGPNWFYRTTHQEQPIWCHPHTLRKNPFSRCTNKHSQLETFSQPYFNKIFSNCLSHNSPAKGWPYRFRSRGTTGSSILDHDLGQLCRGRRIQMSGHSEFGIFNMLAMLKT